MLEKLLRLEPESAELNYLCGLAYSSARNPKQASSYLEKAIRLDGTLVPARAALGEAYLELGKTNAAIPLLKAAVPGDDTGIRCYQLARAYQSMGLRGEYQSALQEYREVVRRRESHQVIKPVISPP